MAAVSVEMWMDFGCPWSRMSLVELPRADSLGRESLEIQFHGLRLDPEAPADYGRTTIENLCAHLSITEEEAEAMLQRVVDAGNQIGVGFNFRTARGANTLDAHRLLSWAHRFGKQSQLADVVWRAHFEDGLLVSDHTVLLACAEEAGLSPTDASAMLDSDQCGEDVLAAEKDAAARGIERTPHFLFSNGVELSGMHYATDFEALVA